MSCPTGKILRSAYVRRDGTKVAAVCVKDMGLQGKTPLSKRIPATLSDDVDLKRFGYVNINDLTADARHSALRKAIVFISNDKKITEREAAVKLVRRLTLLSTLNRNTNITVSKLLERDHKWISKTYVS